MTCRRNGPVAKGAFTGLSQGIHKVTSNAFCLPVAGTVTLANPEACVAPAMSNKAAVEKKERHCCARLEKIFKNIQSSLKLMKERLDCWDSR